MTPTKGTSHLSCQWNQTPRYWLLTLTRTLPLRHTSGRTVGEVLTILGLQTHTQEGRIDLEKLTVAEVLQKFYDFIRKNNLSANSIHFDGYIAEILANILDFTENLASRYIYHRQCKHSPCFYYRYIRNTSTVNPGYFPSSTLTYQKPVKSAYISIA